MIVLCTGRLPKDERYCASLPQLSNYPLPPPVSAWSNTDLVEQNLHQPISALYGIDGNDSWGDCTCAAAAHQITLHNGLTGNSVIPSASDVVALYRKLGHGADNGLALTTVLQAWTAGILGGNKILANCNVDTSNWTAVKQGMQFLGGLYIGFQTTSQTVAQFQNGQPWTVVNNRLQGGHCVVAVDYDEAADKIWYLTWGGIQVSGRDWWDKYVDEAHAILTTNIAAFDSDTVANIQAAMPSLS